MAVLGACLCGGWVLDSRSAVATEVVGSPLARAALAACERAASVTGKEQLAALADGTALANAAIGADPKDPAAYFAAFCSLGRRLELRGLSINSPRELRQARAALDTALTLFPDYVDALAAKGALLLRLPRLLGGDPAQGATLLRRATNLAPDNQATRRLLLELVGEPAPAHNTAPVARRE